MTDNGDTKDDVKVPEGEVGERLVKMFKTDEKDVSKFCRQPSPRLFQGLTSCVQMSLSWPPWARRFAWIPRKPPRDPKM